MMRLRPERLGALHEEVAHALQAMEEAGQAVGIADQIARHLDHAEDLLGDRGAVHARATHAEVRRQRGERDGHQGVLADLRRALVSAWRIDRLDRFALAMAAYAEEDRQARAAWRRWPLVRHDPSALVQMLDEARREDIALVLLARALGEASPEALPAQLMQRLAACEPAYPNQYLGLGRALLPPDVLARLVPTPPWVRDAKAWDAPPVLPPLALAPAERDGTDAGAHVLRALIDGQPPPENTSSRDLAQALLGADPWAPQVGAHLEAWLAAHAPSRSEDRELLARAMGEALVVAWRASGGDPTGFFITWMREARTDYGFNITHLAGVVANAALTLGEAPRAARAILDRARNMTEERRFANNVVSPVPALLTACLGDRALFDALLQELLEVEAMAVGPANLDFALFPLGLAMAHAGKVRDWQRCFAQIKSTWIAGQLLVLAPDEALNSVGPAAWIRALEPSPLALHMALRRVVAARAHEADPEEVRQWLDGWSLGPDALLVESLEDLASLLAEVAGPDDVLHRFFDSIAARWSAMGPPLQARALSAATSSGLARRDPRWSQLSVAPYGEEDLGAQVPEWDAARGLEAMVALEVPQDVLAVALLSLFTGMPQVLVAAGDSTLLALLGRLWAGPAGYGSVQAIVALSAELTRRRRLPGERRLGAAPKAHRRARRLGQRPGELRGEDAAIFEPVGAWAGVVAQLMQRPEADGHLARLVGDQRVARGIRAHLAELREVEVARPSRMVEAMGRQLLMRVAIELLDLALPRGEPAYRWRPASERLTSFAISRHAHPNELATLAAELLPERAP